MQSAQLTAEHYQSRRNDRVVHRGPKHPGNSPLTLSPSQERQSGNGVCINSGLKSRVNDRSKASVMVVWNIFVQCAFSFRLVVELGIDAAIYEKTYYILELCVVETGMYIQYGLFIELARILKSSLAPTGPRSPLKASLFSPKCAARE